jgi:hypothetical protein
VGWLVPVGLCYLLGFGSKEQAIIFPLLLIAFDYVFMRLRSLKFSVSLIKSKVLLEKIPFFLIALSLWYFSTQNNLGVLDKPNGLPFDQRMLLGAHSFMEYIFRSLAPVKLYYFYYMPIKPGEQLPLVYWFYPVLVFIIGYFIYINYRRGNRLLTFGFLIFLINLLLVLHIIPMPRKMVTADRYMYLSIIGAALMLGWMILYSVKKMPALKRWLPTLLAGYFLYLGVHTFYRTTQWKDSETMKSNVKELINKRKESNEANKNSNKNESKIINNQGKHRGIGKRKGGWL